MPIQRLPVLQPPSGYYSPVAPKAAPRLYFGEDDKKPEFSHPNNEAGVPPQGAGFIEKSREVARLLVRKVSNKEEFKQSYRHGKESSCESLKKDFKSGSPTQIAKRVAVETLGVAVTIVFLPFPGPNPGIFISPTVRSFLKGFLKAPPVKPPETLPPDGKGDPKD